MTPQETQDLLLIGGGVAAVVVATVLIKANTGARPQQGSVPGFNVTEQTALLQAGTAAAAEADNYSLQKSANALAALTAYSTTEANLNLGLATISGNVEMNKQNATTSAQIAKTQADAQTAMTKLQTTAATTQAAYAADAAKKISYWQQVAATNVATQEATAQEQSAAQMSAASQAQSHAQQQSSLWGAIGSIATSALSFFSARKQPAQTQVGSNVVSGPDTPGAPMPFSFG